jgi:hypothetical protein
VVKLEHAVDCISQVRAINKKDYSALAAALLELAAEDPALEFEWLREESELQVQSYGMDTDGST